MKKTFVFETQEAYIDAWCHLHGLVPFSYNSEERTVTVDSDYFTERYYLNYEEFKMTVSTLESIQYG